MYMILMCVAKQSNLELGTGFFNHKNETLNLLHTYIQFK